MDLPFGNAESHSAHPPHGAHTRAGLTKARFGVKIRSNMGDAMKTSWHLWVVGLLSLVWHAFGAVDYVMTQTRNASCLAMIPDNVRPAFLAYLDAYPVWASSSWAVGVWGAVLGSLLILLRSRHAVTTLWLSMVGFLVNTANTYLISPTKLDMLTNTNAKLVSLAIFVVLTLVLAYAGRQRALGRLR